MPNDTRNRFSRNAEKQAKVDPATREMSLSQRMTRYRTGEAQAELADGATRWKARAAELEANKPAVISKPTVQRTAAGTIMTPELQAARDAEKARREALKSQANGLAKSAEFVPEDFQATLSGWIQIHATAEDFEPSPFNVQNITRCVYWQVMSGQPGWTKFGISELDAAHKWLRENGYYESAQQKRAVHPGIGSAAKEYPVWQAEEEKSGPVATGNRPVFVRQNETGLADARKMSFDELAKAAKAGRKPDTSRNVTGI